MPLPGILINILRYIPNVFSLIAIHRLRAELVRSERIKAPRFYALWPSTACKFA